MESKTTRHDCWNCGGPGIPYTGSLEQCPSCEVLWHPIGIKTYPLNTEIVYRGVVVYTVDFTKPDAPSSPA